MRNRSQDIGLFGQLVKLVYLRTHFGEEPIHAGAGEFRLKRHIRFGTFARLVGHSRGNVGHFGDGRRQVVGEVFAAPIGQGEASWDDRRSPRAVVRVGGHGLEHVAAASGIGRRSVALRRLRALDIHHEHLQAVFQVGKTHIRVVVERQYLHVGVELLQTLGDASAHDVVG